MATQEEIQAIEAQHLLQVYRRVPIVLTRGEGSYVYDIEGHAYLDFLSGLGVTALGHAHPGLTAAVADQARTLLHTSNLYYHPLQGQVGRRLAVRSPARLLLQQRYGGCGRLPEVRAAVLALAR